MQVFHQTMVRCEKMLLSKVVSLKKIYKFSIENFLIGHVDLILIIKNTITRYKNSSLGENDA